MQRPASQTLGAIWGGILAAAGSIAVALVLYHGQDSALTFSPALGPAGRFQVVVGIISVIWGPAIVGATVAAAIGGAMKPWTLSLLVGFVGMLLAAIPVAVVALVLAMPALDSVRPGQEVRFGLDLLRSSALMAIPLPICPIAAFLGNRIAALRDRSNP